MMPQKKNPDSLELIRGKSGRFIGNYTRFAATLKGVGMTYFKDLQEDKEPLFDSVDHISLVLQVFSKVVATLQVNRQHISTRMDPFLWATDVADYLVNKGIAFREAHRIVGAMVAACIEKKVTIDSLSLQEYQTFSNAFSEDISKVFSWKAAVEHRDVYGGTGPLSVEHQIGLARACLDI
jgi:argininosuccinate lyase